MTAHFVAVVAAGIFGFVLVDSYFSYKIGYAKGSIDGYTDGMRDCSGIWQKSCEKELSS